MTPAEKLEGFDLEALRHEVGLLHGVHGIEGYTWYVDSQVFAREVSPGVWVKLAPPLAVKFSWGGSTLSRIDTDCGPGWSWYVSDAPDRTYYERGGACLGLLARDEAEEAAREIVAAGGFP